MRNKENLHIAFHISSEVCEKKFGRIFATVRESSPYLSIRSQAPTLHHIYRITKQKRKTRSWSENKSKKGRSANPCVNVLKTKQNEKKKIKMTPCMLFSSLLKHTYKRNTYFFSFINGQQRQPKWPINPQNMPNGVAKDA